MFWEYDLDSDLVHGYNDLNSREAPLGVTGEGRNNISGVSYFYASNREETACVEVKPLLKSVVSLATFELKRNLTIIDFSKNVAFDECERVFEGYTIAPLFTELMHEYSKPGNEEIYKITQIISDYIRKYGVDGIAYKSFYDSKGTNYTIFNSSRRNIEFLNSRLLVSQSQKMNFVDFEREMVMAVESLGGENYDDIIAKDIMKTIRDTIADGS